MPIPAMTKELVSPTHAGLDAAMNNLRIHAQLHMLLQQVFTERQEFAQLKQEQTEIRQALALMLSAHLHSSQPQPTPYQHFAKNQLIIAR